MSIRRSDAAAGFWLCVLVVCVILGFWLVSLPNEGSNGGDRRNSATARP